MAMTEQIHRGTCACGKITIEARGAPLRAGLCHCMTCRKLHAAPFMAFATFAAKDVTIMGDDIGVFESSAKGRRHFCRGCGSMIYAQYGRPHEKELYLGSFDETGLWPPTYELWDIRREGWLPAIDTVKKRFERDRPG